MDSCIISHISSLHTAFSGLPYHCVLFRATHTHTTDATQNTCKCVCVGVFHEPNSYYVFFPIHLSINAAIKRTGACENVQIYTLRQREKTL